MRLFLLLSILTLTCGQLENWENYTKVWEDQFDTLDLSKWQHEITAWGGGNSEFEVYTNDPVNSYIYNGVLHLKPTLLVDNINPLTGQPFGDQFLVDGTLDLVAMYGSCTNDGDNSGCYREGYDIPPTMSARLRSFERFSFTYGRVRVRARMPTGDWMYPAIWLLPVLSVYGDWPKSGETDIIGIVGNEDFKNPDGTWAGHQHMGCALHWGPDASENRFYLTTASKTNDTHDYSRSWHMFEMDWSEDGFRFVVDDDELLNVPNPLIPKNPSWTGFWDYGAPYGPQYPNPGWNSTMAPFDQAFHFILNVAVGGTNGFISDDCINRGGDPAHVKPWHNSDNYTEAFHKFYDAQSAWYPTWTKEEEGAAMQIDFIEVWEKNA